MRESRLEFVGAAAKPKDDASVEASARAIRKLADRINLVSNIYFRVSAAVGARSAIGVSRADPQSEIMTAIRALEAAMIAAACKTRTATNDRVDVFRELTGKVAYMVASGDVNAKFFDDIK